MNRRPSNSMTSTERQPTVHRSVAPGRVPTAPVPDTWDLRDGDEERDFPDELDACVGLPIERGRKKTAVDL